MTRLGSPRPGAEPVLAAWAVLVLAFLLGPLAIAVAVSFSSGDRIRFPPPGLSLRWFAEAAGNPQFVEAAIRSGFIAFGSATLSTVAGTGAALAFQRGRFPGRALAETAVLLPLALPGIVLGFAMLPAMRALGLAPGNLAATLAHSVVGIPYAAYLVRASLTHYDPAWDRAAASLGAGPARIFRSITLPLIAPGVVSAFICSFLLSLDNVALSLFVARGDTLPLRLMQHIQFSATPAVAAVSVFLVALSLAALLVLGRILRGDGALRLSG